MIQEEEQMRRTELERKIQYVHELFDAELQHYPCPRMLTPVEKGLKGEYSYTNQQREEMEIILEMYQIKHMWTDTNKLIVEV